MDTLHEYLQTTYAFENYISCGKLFLNQFDIFSLTWIKPVKKKTSKYSAGNNHG